MWSLLVAGCIENAVDSKRTDVPFDSATPTAPTETGIPAEERCDGWDNDGDGVVDEDYPDFDGDGVADCVDDGCTLDPVEPHAALDPACAEAGPSLEPPPDPWTWERAWHAAVGPVYGTPMVGDLDQDGIPEVVVGVEETPLTYLGSVVVLDGATGVVELRIPDADASGGVALADLDGDGEGEILGYFGSGCLGGSELRAYDRFGVLRWSSDSVWSCQAFPAVADLDQDGTPEVIGAGLILDGPTGRLRATFDVQITGTSPVAADLDLDGELEVLVNQDVVGLDGALRFRCGPRSRVGSIHPAQLDVDPEGEVVASGDGLLVACDDDGTELWRRNHTELGAPLAIADFDGDPEQEIAFPNGTSLHLLDADGAELAAVAMSDVTGASGPTLWDLDLDGVPDVVHGDEALFQVVDGATWTSVVRDLDRASQTYFETPSVADVDGDGDGELLYGNNMGNDGVMVLRAPTGAPWTRPVYNQLSYYGDNVADDLSVPARVDPPWRSEARILPGQPSTLTYAGDTDLAVAITGVCVASCGDAEPGAVGVQVWNEGAAVAPPGSEVSLWVDVDGVPALLEARTLADPIPAGGSAELQFAVPAASLHTRLEARVTGPATSCDPVDDVAEWLELPCE